MWLRLYCIKQKSGNGIIECERYKGGVSMQRKDYIVAIIMLIVCIVGYLCTTSYIEYKSYAKEETTTVVSAC